MTVQLKTKKQVEETTEIEIPVFLKRDRFYLGIFDVDMAVKFYAGFNYDFIQVEPAENVIDIEGYERIDEQDFRIEYMKQLEKFALPKRQITTEELEEVYAHT